MSVFRIPAGAGTPFQRRVWALCASIPRGRVRTYGWMAKRLKSSPRAVGQALRANPFAPKVPCHRVVAAGAKVGSGFGKRRVLLAAGIGGYGGVWNSRKKRRMLESEGVRFAR
jgi:methylated-DNA-[protein]-cysteine S-methyltransferase